MIQLGTRWRYGEQPPERLDADIAAKVQEAEALLTEGASLDELRDGRWTLTFLERRPVAEFDIPAADGSYLTVTRNPLSGEPVLRTDTDGEDWDDA